MALIKCINCGHMISDRATKCPKCGQSLVDVEKTEDIFDNKTDSKRIWMMSLAAVFLFCLIGGVGYYVYTTFYKDAIVEKSGYVDKEGKDTLTLDDRELALEKERKIQKEIEVTESLEKIFKDVMSGKINDYDERFFSSDFNSVYREVKRIDDRLWQEEGCIGFWDWIFWDMAQDEVKMDIVVNEIKIIKDNEAMAKVTFKQTWDVSSEKWDEEIKVIFENNKWVLDDIHSYKKKMQEFISENPYQY
jgi:predicted  nucleic acid-binding Zn-ribbon protein